MARRVLCIAGIDPTGAAGLFRDLWALRELGATGTGVPSCLTVQGDGTASLHAVDAYLGEALAACDAPGAVKVGLVPGVATWETILPFVQRFREEGAQVVVDPVRGPSAGGFEAGDDVRDFLLDRVLPLGPVLTPNRPELAWLGGDARALLGKGAAGVLVKGGHNARDDAVEDEWHEADGSTRIARPRHAEAKRGTGCVLSTLLALGLSDELAPIQAARQAGHMVWRLWPKLATTG